jgi:hypothetical protein
VRCQMCSSSFCRRGGASSDAAGSGRTSPLPGSAGDVDVGGAPAVDGTRLRLNSESMAYPGCRAARGSLLAFSGRAFPLGPIPLPLPSPLAFTEPLDIRPPGFGRYDQCGMGQSRQTGALQDCRLPWPRAASRPARPGLSGRRYAVAFEQGLEEALPSALGFHRSARFQQSLKRCRAVKRPAGQPLLDVRIMAPYICTYTRQYCRTAGDLHGAN